MKARFIRKIQCDFCSSSKNLCKYAIDTNRKVRDYTAILCGECADKVNSDEYITVEKDEYKNYKITVTQLVPSNQLDIDDVEENPSGVHTFIGKSEKDALDSFHNTVPISCLEYFDIHIAQV